MGRDVGRAVVDQHVPVADQLPRLRPGTTPAGAVEDVVQPPFEQDQQVLTGPALLARRLLVVATELLLEDAVVVAGLLLLTELEEVLRLLDAAAAVLAWRVRALLEVLVVALEVHAETAGLLGHRTGVSSHGCGDPPRSPRWGCHGNAHGAGRSSSRHVR